MKSFQRMLIAATTVLMASCLLWAGVGIEVTPGGWDIGKGSAGTWQSQQITANNIGNESAMLKIRATDTQNWALSETPSLDVYALSVGDGVTWVPVGLTDTTLLPSLAASAQHNFQMRFQSPTSVTDRTLSAVQSSNVTFSVGILLFQHSTTYMLIREFSDTGIFLSIACDSTHNMVYVYDHASYEIKKYDVNGNFVTKWGGYGSGDEQFIGFARLVIDEARDIIYVLDNGNKRVSKYNSSGEFLGMLVSNIYPSRIALDNLGNIYIGTEDRKILKYDISGTLIMQIDDAARIEYSPDYQEAVTGIVIDAYGNIYISVDIEIGGDGSYVRKYDNQGNFITEWFVGYYVIDICIDSRGYLFVIQGSEGRTLKIYTLGGTFISEIVGSAFWTQLSGIDIANDSNMFLIGFDSYPLFRIRIYAPQ